MLKLIKNYENAIVVLHEIYGINEHIKDVCAEYHERGFDIYCPLYLNMASHLSTGNRIKLTKILLIYVVLIPQKLICYLVKSGAGTKK